ncbi:MAG: putative sensor protein [Myxococcaceae bacterium]|nr:putative sensor protein [Myxococcaceae bacterium]MEA2751878.1 adenylate cyclase [Myxococcales bacterium]
MKVSDLARRCFQGVMPAVIATCDDDGIPNVTYLSHVHYLDATHIALSCQFFNKTKKNVLANRYASIELYDPQTIEMYRMRVRYDHAETSGALFHDMSRRIDAIASHTGMTGIFKLLSADVYEVLEVEQVQGFIEPLPPDAVLDDPPAYRSEVTGLQLVSQRTSKATDLDDLLSTVLEALEQAFGFEHSMVLLCDEAAPRLYAVASRGYGENGVGAEVHVGDGLIGTVARERCILRVAGVGAELRYGRAIRASVHRAGKGRALTPEIPLPGLVDAQSQLALPLVSGDRLVGVLAVESRTAAAFEEWHEAYLEIIASQVALAIENIVRRGREAETEAAEPREPREPQRPTTTPATRARRFVFYPSDDCMFVDDDYLVRNVPGKILWRLLSAYRTSGRTEFTNRELRLDASLGLPAVRDNLESRLVLLRKRLEQKCPDLALVSIGRGQFRLDVACELTLEERTGEPCGA